MQIERIEDIFMHSWGRYSQAIISFAGATKNKSKELKHALRDDDSSPEGKQ